MKICIVAYVSGIVQGVGFRYSTQQQARVLGLIGYAYNMMTVALKSLPVVNNSR